MAATRGEKGDKNRAVVVPFCPEPTWPLQRLQSFLQCESSLIDKRGIVELLVKGNHGVRIYSSKDSFY